MAIPKIRRGLFNTHEIHICNSRDNKFIPGVVPSHLSRCGKLAAGVRTAAGSATAESKRADQFSRGKEFATVPYKLASLT